MLSACDPLYHQAENVLMLQPSRVLVLRFDSIDEGTDSPVLSLRFDSNPGWLLGFKVSVTNEQTSAVASSLGLRLWFDPGEEFITKANPTDPRLVGILAPVGGDAAFVNCADVVGELGAFPIVRRVGEYDILWCQFRNLDADDTHQPTLSFTFSRDGEPQLPQHDLNVTVPELCP